MTGGRKAHPTPCGPPKGWSPRPGGSTRLLIPNRVRAGYVDTTAELGHWLEICQLQREDIEFFSALVSDSA